MPECLIFKDETGKLAGHGAKGHRAYEKFRRVVAGLEPGEMIQFTYKLPRSPQHHRYVFARLSALFDMQESFTDFDQLLVFLKVGAGFVDFMPGPGGQLVAVPKSIAWAELEEKDFTEVRQAMWDFLWTEQAQAALWPHLDANQRYACVDSWSRG
jgi:hypothetical protein